MSNGLDGGWPDSSQNTVIGTIQWSLLPKFLFGNTNVQDRWKGLVIGALSENDINIAAYEQYDSVGRVCIEAM